MQKPAGTANNSKKKICAKRRKILSFFLAKILQKLTVKKVIHMCRKISGYPSKIPSNPAPQAIVFHIECFGC
jgi:hypothetical protein